MKFVDLQTNTWSDKEHRIDTSMWLPFSFMEEFKKNKISGYWQRRSYKTTEELGYEDELEAQEKYGYTIADLIWEDTNDARSIGTVCDIEPEIAGKYRGLWRFEDNKKVN